MTHRYKPTREDARIIRDCAQRSAGYARVEICPGTRYNLEGKHQDVEQDELNICFVSDHPDWDDTDLADNAWKWKDFTKGVNLTDDGKGIFDFYVYAPLQEMRKELQTNVTAYYEGSQLVRVEGTGNGIMWERTSGFDDKEPGVTLGEYRNGRWHYT